MKYWYGRLVNHNTITEVFFPQDYKEILLGINKYQTISQYMELLAGLRQKSSLRNPVIIAMNLIACYNGYFTFFDKKNKENYLLVTPVDSEKLEEINQEIYLKSNGRIDPHSILPI